MSYSSIVDASNEFVEFTSHCDGRCTATTENTVYSWDMRNGGVLLLFDRVLKRGAERDEARDIADVIRAATGLEVVLDH